MEPERFNVSAKYSATKLEAPSLDDLIDVYEDRLIEWLIQPARSLNEHEHAGFAVFQVILAYFEGHEIYFRGKSSKDHSPEFFKSAFLKVFPEVLEHGEAISDQIIRILYEDARCGLYHTGMARKRLILNDAPTAISYILTKGSYVENVILNRHLFVDRVHQHFIQYIGLLRDPHEIDKRTNFEKAWILSHQ